MTGYEAITIICILQKSVPVQLNKIMVSSSDSAIAHNVQQLNRKWHKDIFQYFY